MKHRRITPYWPQANAHAETFNRRLRMMIHSAKLDQKDWKLELHRFLRNYRATPHQSTIKSSVELMFPGRNYRTRLPQLKQNFNDVEVRQRDELVKNRMKEYGDKQFKINNKIFHVGTDY